jgi:NTP pyrophosphatase (non-canonical NTP hydrolase)
MSEKNPQREILKEAAKAAKEFKPGGKFAPIEDRNEYEKQLKSLPAEERELAEVLTQFSNLWQYFSERGEQLGSEIVDSISRVHELPVPERIRRVREINQKLMQRVDAGEGPQFRQ